MRPLEARPPVAESVGDGPNWTTLPCPSLTEALLLWPNGEWKGGGKGWPYEVSGPMGPGGWGCACPLVNACGMTCPAVEPAVVVGGGNMG